MLQRCFKRVHVALRFVTLERFSYRCSQKFTFFGSRQLGIRVTWPFHISCTRSTLHYCLLQELSIWDLVLSSDLDSKSFLEGSSEMGLKPACLVAETIQRIDIFAVETKEHFKVIQHRMKNKCGR